MSRGKKNDHVFHNNCLTYLIKHYDEKRVTIGKEKIPLNIFHTDNCAPQYKCRQKFIQIAQSCEVHCDTTIVHKFVQKYRFKGSWYAARKVIKEAINCLEMRDDCCVNANDCYLHLTRELTKDGNEEKTLKLLAYGQNNDKRVLENTTLQTRRTFVVL